MGECTLSQSTITVTITRLITYQLHNPWLLFRPLNSILDVMISRIYLSLTMGHSTLRISWRFSLRSINSITTRPHPIGRKQMEELRQLLSLLSAYYLLRMTLTWLYSQSAIPHPQDTPILQLSICLDVYSAVTYLRWLVLLNLLLHQEIQQCKKTLPGNCSRNKPTKNGLVFPSEILNWAPMCMSDHPRRRPPKLGIQGKLPVLPVLDLTW